MPFLHWKMPALKHRQSGKVRSLLNLCCLVKNYKKEQQSLLNEIDMELKELLHAVPVMSTEGALDKEVQLLCFDSRDAVANSIFVAVRVVNTDGHLSIENAISKGCSIIVVEELPTHLDEQVTYITVADTAYVLGILASNFYGNPSRELKIVGVTGTNGKTTVATLLYNL